MTDQMDIDVRDCEIEELQDQIEELESENQRLRDALIDLITGTCSILNKE